MFHVAKELRDIGKLDACRKYLEDNPTPTDWRGSSWKSTRNFDGPLEPRLSVDAIVGLGSTAQTAPKNIFERFSGRAYHHLFHQVIVAPKEVLLTKPQWDEAYTIAESLTANGPKIIEDILVNLGAPAKITSNELKQKDIDDLKKCMLSCWTYEMHLLDAEMKFHLNRDSAIETERLVDFIPLESEKNIDGSRLRLSDKLAADGLFTLKPTIIELKTGPTDRERHRVGATGYALALESVSGTPVDFGCITYMRMRKDKLAPQFECDVFPIDIKYRSLFIEWRNRRMFETDGERASLEVKK